MMFITRLPLIKILGGIFLAALTLRLFRVDTVGLKEDEFTTVKAATYIYQCGLNPEYRRYQVIDFKDKWLALFAANETVPNPIAEIYLWDFIRDRASDIHHSRAWPHLYSVAAVYRILGINELSSRVISVIAGSLLVIVGYLFSRVLGSSINLSLLYSGLLALAFPLIDFSRNARMYSLYSLIFLLLITAIYRSKWLLAGILFLLAYWLQMLTLILPLGLLIWALWQKRVKLAAALLLGLGLVISLNDYFQVDFFGRQFLTVAWPPHWFYLQWWFLGALAVLYLKRETYLFTILAVYLIILTFFSRPDPAGAYLVALWPLGLLALLNWRRWLTVVVSFVVVINFGLKIPYLYFNRDGRADIPAAYAPLIDNWQAGDKIFAIQLRDYYLQELPSDTPVIDLQKEPAPEFTGSGYVVWEEEKTHKLDPNTLAFIRSNFRYMGGYGVEIYSFGK